MTNYPIQKRNNFLSTLVIVFFLIFLVCGIVGIAKFVKEKTEQVIPQITYIYQNSGGSAQEQKTGNTNEREVSDRDFNIGRRYTDVFVQGNDLTDNYGHTYKSAYQIIANDKTLKISLDGTYRYLKGSFALSYEDSGDDFNYARVTIYDGNGKKFYVSRDISKKDPSPIDLYVDVSGLSTIEVEIEGYDRYVIPVTLISEGLYLTNE